MIDITPVKIYTSSRTVSHFISISSHNAFIPFHALSGGKVYSKGEDKILVYSLDFDYPSRSSVRKLSSFIGALEYASYPYLYVGSSLDKSGLVAMSNILLQMSYTKLSNDEMKITFEILMTLTVKQDFIFGLDRNNIDPKKLCLVVSKKVLTDYPKLYRNLKKLYIDNLHPDIDIIYTHDLESLCYNQNVVLPPSIKTPIELRKFSKELNQEIYESLAKQERQRQAAEEKRRKDSITELSTTDPTEPELESTEGYVAGLDPVSTTGITDYSGIVRVSTSSTGTVILAYPGNTNTTTIGELHQTADEPLPF